MSAALLQQLRQLADARAHKVALADELKARRAAFDLEHAALIEDLRQASSAVEDGELQVRTLAESQYRATGEKDVAPGVSIKLFKTYEITDRVAAETWAKETKLALIPESLDEKALMKIASVTVLPFVAVGETPKVTIATQLNAAVYAEVTA